MRILHIAPDEKFIDFARINFERAAPGQNTFLIKVPDVSRPFRYVTPHEAVRPVDTQFLFSAECREILGRHDALVIHSWSSASATLALRAPYAMKVLWSGWGFDYYDFVPAFRDEAFGPLTAAALSAGALPRAKEGLGKALGKILRRRVDDYLFHKALHRVDYFSAPIPEDFALLKAGLPFGADYVQINYGSVDDTFRPGPDRVSGKNILVGNSASPTNNHLEVFRLLQDLDLGEREIIVPLSYGDKAYQTLVVREGQRMLGDRFRPLTSFMPLQSYNALIASCQVVIMNQRRQQALGNIGAMLHKGARLYLHPEGPVYSFFRSRGAQVHPLDELVRSAAPFALISGEDLAINRNVLESFWGQDVVLRNTKDFLDIVANTGPANA